MPFLNLDLDYEDHPKTRRLVGLLGKGAEMIPIRLWAYCGKYHCETGELTAQTPQEIESIVKWWGPSGKAVEAMIGTGFLDKKKRGYAVHDWKETQGHIHALKVQAKRAAMARWKKMGGDTGGMPGACSGDAALPDQTGPDQPTPTPAAGKPPDGVRKPYEIKTPGQQVVAAYKILTGFELEDRGWDAMYYPRFKKSAEALLKFFEGDVKRCCECMEGVKAWAEGKRLDWTLETLASRAADWKTGRLYQ